MNLFDGGYRMEDDTQQEPPIYKARLLRRGRVYVTDAGQEFKGDGRRFGVFCDGLIVTTPKPDGPNEGMSMPEIYSNGIYAARVVERLMARDAQRREYLL
jgi:hypothetical protein